MGTTSLGITYPDASSPVGAVQAHLKSLADTTNAAIAGEEWVTATLINGWAHFDARTVQYRRKGNEVWMRGLAKSGAIPSACLTLPIGYRPPTRATYDAYFAVVSNGAFGQITVNGDGTVRVETGSNVWVSFDNVRFLVD